jgi:hypothetical protein
VDRETKAYLQRQRDSGKTGRETLRCLKRRSRFVHDPAPFSSSFVDLACCSNTWRLLMRLRVMLSTAFVLLALGAAPAFAFIHPNATTLRAIRNVAIRAAHHVHDGFKITAVSVTSVRISANGQWSTAFVATCFSNNATTGCTLRNAPSHGETYTSVLHGKGTTWKQVSVGSDFGPDCYIPVSQRKSLGAADPTQQECKDQ